jgi:catechol 2,3-dioxygenase-like lactoylglutathione lyase family enzyme
MMGKNSRSETTSEVKQWIAVLMPWLLLACGLLTMPIAGHSLPMKPRPAAVSIVDLEAVSLTVADMNESLRFYTQVLPFRKVSDVEVAGTEFERLEGVFGLRMRVVHLRLGAETLELTEFLTPKGRPYPADMRSNDRTFQHVAIIVRDMTQAGSARKYRGLFHAATIAG